MTYNHTENGNQYIIDGIFAFTKLGGLRLTAWESQDELEAWVDSQYENEAFDNSSLGKFVNSL
jgi:hypothetical protein